MSKKGVAVAENVKSITYDNTVLSLINDLSTINQSVIFEKDKKNIVIKRSNPSTTVAYSLTVPVETFNFQGDKLGFYNYSEFYQLVSFFDNPVIKQKVQSAFEKVVISEGQENFSYVLSDPEILPKGPTINFKDPVCSFELTKEHLDKFVKVCGILGAEFISFTVKGSKINCSFFKEKSQNIYNKTFTATNSDASVDFTFKVDKEIIDLLPKGRDYTVDIKDEGILMFSLKDKNVSLKLYAAEAVDED